MEKEEIKAALKRLFPNDGYCLCKEKKRIILKNGRNIEVGPDSAMVSVSDKDISIIYGKQEIFGTETFPAVSCPMFSNCIIFDSRRFLKNKFTLNIGNKIIFCKGKREIFSSSITEITANSENVFLSIISNTGALRLEGCDAFIFNESKRNNESITPFNSEFNVFFNFKKNEPNKKFHEKIKIKEISEIW